MKFLYKKIKTFCDYFPFRIGFILFAIFSIFAYERLKDNFANGDAPTLAVLAAVLKYLFLFACIVLIIAFLSLIIAYAVFIMRLKKNPQNIQVKINSTNSGNAVKSVAKIKFEKILFPVFGTIKARFIFSNKRQTPKYALSPKRFRLFSGKNYESQTTLYFNDINNYVLKSVKLYFEDYFSMFSLPFVYNADTQFYVLPQKNNDYEISAVPVTQRETSVRSDIVRPIDGELLRFKNFEASDDVRRIVWQVYAKSKDLVVRSAEIRNPYASVAPVYVSFYGGANLGVDEKISRQFLNYYKNAVWSVYSSLTKGKDLVFELHLDQQIKATADNENLPTEMYRISAANWQKTIAVNDLYKPGDVSVLCISSFVNTDDLRDTLDRISKSTIVVFVKIGCALKINPVKVFLKNLFVKPRAGSINDLQFKYLFSPTRKIIAANEKQISEILSKSNNTYHEI